MTTQKLEYDCNLGGEVVLGSHVPTFRYAAAAVQEINQLCNAIKNPTSTKLIFQRLPKHMRRRAMSHHPKRLPRKYRVAHKAQFAKSGPQKITKRPSRKYRRRPRNLLREYLRRQRRHKWLETHIWHARRFHMIERWGYRLPYASCDKTFRACYRATTNHCLVQDISYYACIELKGTVQELRQGFARLSSESCGLGIAAKTYRTGRREGSIELFRDGQYPSGALDRVSFIWRPMADDEVDDAERTRRVLWIWVHPSGYQVILEELIKVFELVSTRSVKVELKGDEGELMKDVESCKALSAKTERRLQFMTKTCAYERIKRYKNKEKNLCLSELRDTMNRFRLTGALAQSVLAHAFKPKQWQVINKQQRSACNWFDELLSKSETLVKHHETQAEYWRQCRDLTSPAALLSNMVLALNIEHPNLQRPPKRTKAVPTTAVQIMDQQLPDCLVDTPSCLPQSAIWDATVRDRICEEMLTQQEYCQKRAQHAVVPGALCQFELELPPIPVLLIQRPGAQQTDKRRAGYGCGWDVILPAGFGMATWMALIMWGAKPGGLRESESIAREAGTEQQLPDTIGGAQAAASLHDELRLKYFRLPPNKRCNYNTFAIVSPFRAPFPQLVRDWLPESTEVAAAQQDSTHKSFFILRDRSLLQALCNYVNRKCVTFPVGISPKCLIQLQLRMTTRGSPERFSLICLPAASDFKRYLRNIKHEQKDPIYTEPLLNDPNHNLRKRLRLEHKKCLKRLRRKRVREKRKLQETSTTRVHIRPAGTAQMVKEHFRQMCALWVPENYSTLYTVRKQCTRDVFGYVNCANFCLTEGTVCLVGYVTSEGLKELMQRQLPKLRQNFCLVRANNSRDYRFANFQINLQV